MQRNRVTGNLLSLENRGTKVAYMYVLTKVRLFARGRGCSVRFPKPALAMRRITAKGVVFETCILDTVGIDDVLAQT